MYGVDIDHFTVPADDFLVSDESTYGDEEDEFVSTYLLCGPPGVGKTAAVYALASELGYKVSQSHSSTNKPLKNSVFSVVFLRNFIRNLKLHSLSFVKRTFPFS